MYILGAGMSGCIAAILNGRATVLEAASGPPTNHKAVLRFRTDQISKVTGIPFKKVNVHKSIFYNGAHVHANPQLANMYSRKVTGKYLNRSIWNLDQAERFVAPSNFHQQLIDMINDRIVYGAKVITIDRNSISILLGERIERKHTPIISTLPMPVLDRVTDSSTLPDVFHALPIATANCEVANCNINHTVYFPGNSALYRATVTGGNLIMEFACGELTDGSIAMEDALELCAAAFGILESDISDPVIATQRYGKIAPVDDAIRKAFMFEMTSRLGIYSLGRFAVWKNILLDDVYSDVFAIRRMIEQSHYDMRKEM